MGTTLKFRGVAGAVVDGSARDLPQLNRLQFPVFSRGVAPGTTVGHYRATAQRSGHLRRREGQSGRHHLGRRRRRGGDPQGQGGRDSEEGASAGLTRSTPPTPSSSRPSPWRKPSRNSAGSDPRRSLKGRGARQRCSAALTWVSRFSTTARRRQRPGRSRRLLRARADAFPRLHSLHQRVRRSFG